MKVGLLRFLFLFLLLNSIKYSATLLLTLAFFFTLPLSHTRVECVCVCAVLHNVNKQNNRFVVRYSFHVLRTFVRSSELITDAAQLSLPVHILRALRIIGRLRSFISNVSFFCLIILYSIII